MYFLFYFVILYFETTISAVLFVLEKRIIYLKTVYENGKMISEGNYCSSKEVDEDPYILIAIIIWLIDD